ncbi:ABC transporter [Nonomuraea solani]|uniref:ABC transporter n=1 Tax=Nonomuraea solani TaxID=1144553 RepID=A0A1H6BQA6_9ACTN|nr:ATP-binding cassette domain-containing protein [Nonomuraea solani]SEG62850.1 ABC transporter [Nonomuraea solani]
MIDVRGLSMRYGRTRAVDDLTFSVKPRLVTGFLGPNGAGTSTTMRVVLGLEVPAAGQTLVNGRPHASIPRPSSTSRLTGWTRKTSAGCAACCVRWRTKAVPRCCPAV